MRVLVTGGAGFIGSAVCKYLIGETRSAMVNLDSLTYAANLRSLAEMEADPRHGFVRGDVCVPSVREDVFRRFEPDAVMHPAAESHVDRSLSGAKDFAQTNIVGTYTPLVAARQYWKRLPEARHKSFRFLHVSTDGVYGNLGRYLDEIPGGAILADVS